MKRIYLLFAILLLTFITNGCIEDDELQEPTTTDISVTSSENLIYWTDSSDLQFSIDNALNYNYGNVLESEIEKGLNFNSDSTIVLATINIKVDFQDKYFDSNPSNNSVEISLERMLINTGYQPTSESDYLNVPYQNLPIGSYNDLDSSHDFSDLMPPVGNQSTANSCVGWATGYYLKSYHEKIENGYSYTDLSDVMSPNFIWNQIDNDCNGSQFDDAFELLKQQGICSYQSMPYTLNCSTQPNSQQQQEALNNKILNYYRINYSDDIINEVKYYLSNDIPIIISIKIDDEFKDKKNINYQYIYYGVTNTSNIGLHALTLVGYDDDINAVKAINSFDDDWGNEGYCWISYDLFTDGSYFYNNTIREAYWTEDVINNSGQSIISLSNDIDFGNTQINTTPNTQTLTISNNGNDSFNVSDIISSNSVFSIVNGQSATIQANSSIDVEIQFTPTQEQNYSATITVINDADSGDNTIQVTGIGIDNNSNTSTISLSGNLDFGDVEINQSATRTLSISNIGTSDFNVSSINNPDGFSSNYSGIVTAGNSVEVTVTFTPTIPQNYNSSITVNSDADNGNNQINCFGNGVDGNTFGTLMVVNNTNFQRFFHIKKQSDSEYSEDNQIVIPGGETSYYYNLEIGVYNYEADNSGFYAPYSIFYSSGQINITSGNTTTLNINN